MVRTLVLAVVGLVMVVVLGGAAATYWLTSGDGPRVALEQQASAWLGQPVEIGAVEATLFPRTGLEVRDVRVGSPARFTLAQVEVSTDFAALWDGRIEDADVVVADTRLELPMPWPSSTRATAAASPSDGGLEIASIRTISLQNVRLVSRGREFVVSADSSLTPDRLTLDGFTAETGSTRLEAEGSVDLTPEILARLTARADRLDVDELLALGQAFAPADEARDRSSTARPSAPPPARLIVALTADAAAAGGVEVSGLTTEMVVEGDRVSLSPLSFAFFGGRYEGAIDVELGAGLGLTIESSVDGLDVAALAAFGGSTDTVTGTLDGRGTFEAGGEDFERALASARGEGSVTIVDGEIQRLDLVRTVILAFGRPEPDTLPPSDAFDQIDTSFSLADQTIVADRFALRSRDADLDGTATLALASGGLEGAVQMRLSPELSAQAGRDLVRYTRDGDRVLLPATLGGELEDPELSVDVGAAVERGLINEAGRQLERLFGR